MISFLHLVVAPVNAVAFALPIAEIILTDKSKRLF